MSPPGIPCGPSCLVQTRGATTGTTVLRPHHLDAPQAACTPCNVTAMRCGTAANGQHGVTQTEARGLTAKITGCVQTTARASPCSPRK